MQEIKWIPEGSSSWVVADIGGITMACGRCMSFTANTKPRWNARISVSFIGSATKRRGPKRYSLKKAKEDAIMMACELLLDYHAGLMVAMDKFGLTPEN